MTTCERWRFGQNSCFRQWKILSAESFPDHFNKTEKWERKVPRHAQLVSTTTPPSASSTFPMMSCSAWKAYTLKVRANIHSNLTLKLIHKLVYVIVSGFHWMHLWLLIWIDLPSSAQGADWARPRSGPSCGRSGQIGAAEGFAGESSTGRSLWWVCLRLRAAQFRKIDCTISIAAQATQRSPHWKFVAKRKKSCARTTCIGRSASGSKRRRWNKRSQFWRMSIMPRLVSASRPNRIEGLTVSWPLVNSFKTWGNGLKILQPRTSCRHARTSRRRYWIATSNTQTSRWTVLVLSPISPIACRTTEPICWRKSTVKKTSRLRS